MDCHSEERDVRGDSYLATWKDGSPAGQAQLAGGVKHLELAAAVNVVACGKLFAFTLDSHW